MFVIQRLVKKKMHIGKILEQTLLLALPYDLNVYRYSGSMSWYIIFNSSEDIYIQTA